MAFGTTNLQGSPQALGATFYNKTIDNSLRMGDAQNSTLQWSAGTPSSTSIWTMSFWIKFWDPEAGQAATEFFSAGTGGSAYSFFALNASEQFIHQTELPGARNKGWDRIIRDPSSWYHFVLRADLNQTATADKLKWYVNGVLETDTFTDGISQSTWSFINASGVTQNWGGKTGIANGNPGADVYLAEINFCDGQSYGPEKFGEDKNGVWIPREPNVTYGNNGYRLEFKQTGTGTGSASTVGADTSGRNNHFDSSGIASQDVLPDSPTNNFATMNSVAYTNGINLTKGNLIVATTTNNRGIHGTFSLPPSGKWYYEVHVDSYATNGGTYLGWGTDASLGHDEYASNKGIFFSGYNEQVLLDGSGQSGGYGVTSTNVVNNGDIYSILLDVDGGLFYYAKNGTYFNSADPAAGTGGLDVSATLAAAITRVTPCITRGGSYNETYSVNFGQDASFAGNLTGGNVGSAIGGGGTFKYAPPAGFKALKASNLPEPTFTPRNDSIENSYFYTVLYEGNSGGQRVGQFLPLNEVKTVNNSIIFNDDDTSYLSKTLSSGNRRTWTWSSWVKRGNVGLNSFIFGAGSNASNFSFIGFSSNDTIDIRDYTGGSYIYSSKTSRKFKNTSKWYHIVLHADMDNSTNTDRIKLYIDGERITDWGTAPSPSSTDLLTNSNIQHVVGVGYYNDGSGLNSYFDGYLADVHFVDGQALDPTYFGQTDTSTEKWIPKTYSGSHGTNGFHLEFLDSAAIGADSAGTNNWSVWGLVSSDQVIDTPTKTFCVYSPLYVNTATLSEGSLKVATASTTSTPNTRGTLSVLSGKWYWEVLTADSASSNRIHSWAGLASVERATNSLQKLVVATGNGVIYGNSGALESSLTAWSENDIIGVALDCDNTSVQFYRNGSAYGSAVDYSTFIPDTEFLTPFIMDGASSIVCTTISNFGQNPSFSGTLTGGNIGTATDGLGSLFKYTPPAGYKSLNNDNLPDQTRSVSRRKIPALTWIKNRDTTDYHVLTDQIRGANKFLKSHETEAQTEDDNTLQKFLPGGFQLGDKGQVNTAGESYVAWNWCMHDHVLDAGAQSNSDGNITSSVLADKKLGFSMGTFTKGSGAQTVGHGLSQAPDMYVVKRYTGGTGSWFVYHKNQDATAPEDYYIRFNSDATVTNDATVWNDTAPTNSVFTVAGAFNSGEELLFYAWHSVPGFSKFGSYDGNADADGVYVPLDFRPGWVVIKRIGSGGWHVFDNQRSPTNANDDIRIEFDNSDGENNGSSNNLYIDFVSNGFKLRTLFAKMNGSSRYVYWAMAESPFKYSNAR